MRRTEFFTIYMHHYNGLNKFNKNPIIILHILKDLLDFPKRLLSSPSRLPSLVGLSVSLICNNYFYWYFISLKRLYCIQAYSGYHRSIIISQLIT